MLPIFKYLDILECPLCHYPLSGTDNSLNCCNRLCYYHDNAYPLIGGKPVLVDFKKSLIDDSTFTESNVISPIKRRHNSLWISRLIKSAISPYSKVSITNLEKCREILSVQSDPRVLIIGGGTQGFGCDEFARSFAGTLIAFDVYSSIYVDLIADAHSIPFRTNTFDLVIIQAVLEHVIFPYVVANECERVLKVDGLIYSEIPFLQQVHEGAYDFTRFTPLGHRILFKNFTTIESGSIGGSGVSLLWSIENFFSGLFRNRIVGKIAKLFSIWIVLLERIIPDDWNNDGACASYFIGRKVADKCQPDFKSYLREYAGSQK